MIDPIDIVTSSGCDALRFALCFSASGQDIPLSTERVEIARYLTHCEIYNRDNNT